MQNAVYLAYPFIGHWEKRHGKAMEANVRPTNLDQQELADLFRRYGGKRYEEKLPELMDCLSLVARSRPSRN